MATTPAERLQRHVVEQGICTSCGACALLSGNVVMVDTDRGPLPGLGPDSDVSELAWDVCPGREIDYPELYRIHYGAEPEHWLIGQVVAARTGHATDPKTRREAASVGVMTAVLIHLLETGRIDGAFVVRQGIPKPEKARVVLARTVDEIRRAAQSVYIPVSVLDGLRAAVPGETYAMTCLPDQAAALRALQASGHKAAQQVEYLLGPYTGTALYPAAIRALLRSNGIRRDDAIASLQWRAGEWPGHLEIVMSSGTVVTSKKVYYNFLIPFFVTRNSLQSIDFTNEFCDLSVGDAWSPAFESDGGGHSVFVTRSAAMENVIREMEAGGALSTGAIAPLEATDMHGHMLDFKKRGGYIRNTWCRALGIGAPEYHVAPRNIPFTRYAIEAVVSTIFLLGGTRPARWAVSHAPERLIGPFFNRLRLGWKRLSRPTKRAGLLDLEMETATTDE